MEPHMAAQPNQNSLFITTEGHDSDIGMTKFWGFHLGPQQRGAQRITAQTFNILIVGMGKRDGDEHGPHYHSCATEWGWGEDENQPPYKQPKAIIWANVKTQLDYQPTFHTKKKNRRWNHLEGRDGTKSHLLVSSGGARGDQVDPGSHTTTTHTQLEGLGEQRGNFPHMPPGTSMADITAHALLSGDGEKIKIDHPTNDPRPPFGKTRKHNLITNPPFTRKEKPPQVSSGGARGDQVPFAGII